MNNRNTLGTIRKFKTAQFTVIVDAIEEIDLDISYDDTTETRDNLESGKWIAFCARARVIHADLGEIAFDYLGNCVYASLEDFAAPRSYFQDMVRRVCDEARKSLRKAQNIRVRGSEQQS